MQLQQVISGRRAIHDYLDLSDSKVTVETLIIVAYPRGGVPNIEHKKAETQFQNAFSENECIEIIEESASVATVNCVL